jgi:hypothetical protein
MTTRSHNSSDVKCATLMETSVFLGMEMSVKHAIAGLESPWDA